MIFQENSYLIKIYILMVAVVVLLCCSQCSPLFLTNQWADANIYFTIGRAMLDGQLPYVDLYDHKGPIIYLLHMLAAAITNKSFFGVWLLEIVCAWGFLYFAYKSVELFMDEYALICVPLIAIFVFTSNTFASGDSAEELCSPFLMYSFYTGIKAVKGKTLPNIQQCLLLGICLAYVFWLKFTMAGFFVGYAVFFAVYSWQKYSFKEYNKVFVVTTGSFVLFSLLIIEFFYLQNGLHELVQVYFCDNFFTYNSARDFSLNNIVDNLKTGIFSLTYYYYIGLAWMILGWHYLLNNQPKEIVGFNVCCFLCLFLSSFAGGRAYNYYNFVFCIFLPLGFCILKPLLMKFSNVKFYKVLVAGVILCCTAAYFSPNKVYRGQKCDDFYLTPYAKIIASSPGATLINYQVMDLGLYNLSGVIPHYKYFSLTNIRKPEMQNGLDNYIESQKVDFILTLKKHNFPNYTCVYASDYYEYESVYPLCLYKRIDK